MPITYYDEKVAQLKNELILKPLRGFITTAKMDVIPPTSLTTGASSQLIQFDRSKWGRLGNISKKNGVAFTKDSDSSAVESWGANDPTREDLTKNINGAKFVCQETRKETLAIYHNIDLDGLPVDPVTREVIFDEPSGVRTIYRRIMFLGVDGYGEDEVYIGKLMPKFNITKLGDQGWDDENPLTYDITGNAKVDSALGTSVRYFFGGPGWRRLVTHAGFKNQWSLTITGTAGTYKLSVDDVPTAAIAFGATNPDITTALEQIVGAGNVTVTGTTSKVITLPNGGELELDVLGLTGTGLLV